MNDFSIQEATRQIQFSRGQKAPLASWWRIAQFYHDNEILVQRRFDPRYLADKRTDRWGVSNKIPDLARSKEAFVAQQPFNVVIQPVGFTSDLLTLEVCKHLQTLHDYYHPQDAQKVLLREIVKRMDLFNGVGLMDYWDDLRDAPGARIVTHNDLFFDTTATENFNETDGPRWFAVRRYLTPDVAGNRYGDKRLATMRRGVTDDERKEIRPEAYTALSEMYEVIEWFGIDETEEKISEEETRTIVLSELAQLYEGTLSEVDPDIDHRKAVEVGDEFMVQRAKSMVGPESRRSVKTINDAYNVFGSMQQTGMIDSYMQWRESHAGLVDDENAMQGMKPRFEGYIYRAEFQYGGGEALIEPEVCDYPHYQLPISFFRGHQTTDSLWGKGKYAEVLSLQAQIEWWENARMDHASVAGRPPLIINEDALGTEYRNKSKEWWLETMVRGFRFLFVHAPLERGRANDAISFAQVGTFSWDVKVIIDDLKAQMQEIIGPIPVLRGQVGSEASGKQVQLRQESASTPITDTLSLTESQLTKHARRRVTNIFHYAPIEKIQAVCGMEAAMLIEQARNSMPDFECAVEANLGQGMPKDWLSKSQFILPLVDKGWYSVNTGAEILNLPKPDGPMAMPPQPMMGPGMAPGGPGMPGVTPEQMAMQGGMGGGMPMQGAQAPMDMNMMQGAQAGVI